MRAARLFALPLALCLIGLVPIEGGDVRSTARGFAIPAALADPTPTAQTAETPEAESSAKTSPDESEAGPSSSEGDLPEFVPQHQNLSFGADADAATSEPDGQPATGAGKAAPSGSTQRAVSIKVEPIPTGATETASVDPLPKPPEWPEFFGAKNLFGQAKKPTPMAARAIGYYARGCLSGAEPLPVDGPAWQEMRLSRNRNWGHPVLIALIKNLAIEAKKDGEWPGLLVGDISQPRGGPMITGHASHQVGLDADVWLTPMPKKRLTVKERETLQATSMLDDTGVAVDPKVFTGRQVSLIKRAASYPEVERIFVHPAIKKALCEAAGTDRLWLGKVRPIYGHYYHFHIRIKCPPGFAGCKSQVPPTGNDGCGKEVDKWLSKVIPAKPSAKPPVVATPAIKLKPPKPPVMLSDLPTECRALLASEPDPISVPHKALLSRVAVKKALAKAAAARLAFAKEAGLVPDTDKDASKSPALRPHLNRTADKK